VTSVTAPAPSGRQVLRFLFNRNVFSLVLLSSLPSAIAVVGFLNYFCPIYLNRVGASQSNIGRIFMIYGICLILLAPYVSRFIDASDSKKKFIVMAGLIGGLGFLSFNVLTGYIAAAAVVFMLGLSDSFDQSRNAYALKLKITRELGTGKAFGIFNAASRIGQVVGPFLFGWMLLTVGGTNVIVWFGIFYLVVTLLFLAVAQNDHHMTT
jgi:predicted MFS family arabinose efflux permease